MLLLKINAQGQVNSIVLPWVANNLSVSDKIKETNEWLDSKLEELEVFKPKETHQDSSKLTELSQRDDKQDAGSKNQFSFISDKLNEIAS